jgi:hypothetical protein
MCQTVIQLEQDYDQRSVACEECGEVVAVPERIEKRIQREPTKRARPKPVEKDEDDEPVSRPGEPKWKVSKKSAHIDSIVATAICLGCVLVACAGIGGVQYGVLGVVFAGIVLAVILLAVWVAILVWVAQDSRDRGLEGGSWVLVVGLLHLIGLIVYLSARPQGDLVSCDGCGNKRLPKRKCSHCGAG